jgi:hypothetical protein
VLHGRVNTAGVNDKRCINRLERLCDLPKSRRANLNTSMAALLVGNTRNCAFKGYKNIDDCGESTSTLHTAAT